MNNHPLVSVIIPTHNRKEYIGHALDSVIGQTYENLEIIIVIDGSSDGTGDFLKNKYNDIRIVYIHLPEPQGAAFARNTGIRLAKGSLITFLDDDDYALKDRVRELTESYRDQYSFVCSNYVYKYETYNQISKYRGEVGIDQILSNNITGNSILTSREKLNEIGGFDENLFACQDYDLSLRLILKFGNALMISTPTYVVNSSLNRHRITNNINAFRGYLDFYQKHRLIFNQGHRGSRLLDIYLHQRKKVSLKKLLIFGPENGYLNMLTVFMQYRYPYLFHVYVMARFYLRNILKPHLIKYNHI